MDGRQKKARTPEEFDPGQVGKRIDSSPARRQGGKNCCQLACHHIGVGMSVRTVTGSCDWRSGAMVDGAEGSHIRQPLIGPVRKP
jgi:hypothetical protein